MDMSVSHFLQAGHADDANAGNDTDAGTEREALRDFLASNYARLHRRLVRHLGCAEQASDCLHDAWLRLGDMTLLPSVRSPEAYVFRVACNVAIDRLRSNGSRHYVQDDESELDQFPDHAPGPEEIALMRSDLAAVERAMHRLPRRHRDILIALRIDELTRADVCRQYGLSLRSVDTVLRQALDFCARQADQAVTAGVRGSRRLLPQERMPVALMPPSMRAPGGSRG